MQFAGSRVMKYECNTPTISSLLYQSFRGLCSPFKVKISTMTEQLIIATEIQMIFHCHHMMALAMIIQFSVTMRCHLSTMYDVWHLGISQEQQKRTAASFLLKLGKVCRVSEKSISDIIDVTTHLFNPAFMVSETNDLLSCNRADA